MLLLVLVPSVAAAPLGASPAPGRGGELVVEGPARGRACLRREGALAWKRDERDSPQHYPQEALGIYRSYVACCLLLSYIAVTNKIPAQRVPGSFMGFVGLYIGGLGYQEKSRELAVLGWALAAAGAFLVTLNLPSLA